MKIVISDSLNNDANNIKEHISLISQNIELIRFYLDTIPKWWEGDDATSFLNKYNEAYNNLKKYETEFSNYCDYLSKVFGIFKALDESYDRPINTN